jgi:hypothetical protein
LLRALAGHPALERLALQYDDAPQVADAAAVGEALAALVAADAPALRILTVKRLRLGDAGLRPLVAALETNSHLRRLCVGSRAGVSEALVAEAQAAMQRLGQRTGHGATLGWDNSL